MDFTEFALHESLLQGISDAGYVSCTPVQEQMLKLALDGSDLYVQSQTGTGKTASYIIPILQELLTEELSNPKSPTSPQEALGGCNSPNESNNGKVLVLLPTRELAIQVEEEFKTLASHTNFTSCSFYGGVGYEKQLHALKKGVDFLVATPGRIIDLQESGKLNLSNVSFLVIDEADRMFDMGFYPDLRKLLKVLPFAQERQTMLFSATLNSYVKNLAWEYTLDAKEITIEAETVIVEQIDQELLHVSSEQKVKLLTGILLKENPESVLIFCNTKRSCEVIAKRLSLNGFKSEFIIGDLPQKKRLEVLNQFKNGDISILVATDVAARGIDVHDLAMVVNYDLPVEAENYVHRIGRTARAGKSGKAYTFCSEQDVYNLPAIERYIEMQIPSKVVDDSLLGEDKSEGIYIKTENWGEDREEKYFRKEYSHERRIRDSENKFKFNKREFDKNKGWHKKEEHSKGSSRISDDDASKLQSMSFEDRMKLYKEKYSSLSSKNSYANTGRYPKEKYFSSSNHKQKKSFSENKSKSYVSDRQKDFSKKTYHSKDYGSDTKSAKKGLQSISFWSKVKSFFGK